MKNLDFEWLTDEFMLYCRSTQLREKTMSSYTCHGGQRSIREPQLCL